MKLSYQILGLILIPVLGICQYESHNEFFFEIGDTLTVVSQNGIILRDSTSANSGKLILINYGQKVIAKSSILKHETLQNRKGFWIMIEYNKKIGYAFSGFLTRLKIPKFNIDNLDCHNLSWLEDVARFNADSFISKGYKKYKGFDLDGKDHHSSDWEIYSDETIINHSFGYEYEIVYIESTDFTMNDILNLIEYYTEKLRLKCKNNKYIYGNYEEIPIKIDVTKNNNDEIIRIECSKMWFIAEKTVHKIVMQIPLWDL